MPIMKRLKKGDDVIIIAGKNKGNKGTILTMMYEKNRVIVEGINMVKKNIKPNPKKGIDGGIIEKEASIDSSNVALYNPHTKKGGRIGVKNISKDGNNKKARYFKSNKELV